MYFETFFVEGIGHLSYLVGSDSTHEAFVVDPGRDPAPYLRAARDGGVRIRAVLETHVHNDFLSGAKDLAAKAGAAHVASARAGLQFGYRGVNDGDELCWGELLVRALATPGHTPEHIAYALYDTGRTRALPIVVFSGGDLLVGAVGRPDLLGRVLGEELAPQLYDSLHQKLLPLGDGTIVAPTHGGGSLCGKNIAMTRFSTIGYERATNPALRQPNRAAFVRHVLDGNPGIPTYYPRMRPANQAGPDPIACPHPLPLPVADVQHLAGHGATILDTRSPGAFGAGHLPDAVNVPLAAMLATWTGWVVPADTPLILVLERDADWDPVTLALLRIGYEKVTGYLLGGITAWTDVGLPIVRLEQTDARSVAAAGLQIVDVRQDSEWAEGHISGAVHAPLGVALPSQIEALPLDPRAPTAVICGSGYRSSIAASLLQQHGFSNVSNIVGGMSAWKAAGLPVV